MPDYQNGKIYKLESSQTDKVYIGSTCQLLCKRFWDHKADYKSYNTKGTRFISSFEILKFDDVDIYLIEAFPCNSKEELHSREGYWIKQLDCVNMKIAGRNMKQYCIDNKDVISEKGKKWRMENKEHKRETDRKYREANMDKIKLKKRAYYEANKEHIKAKEQKRGKEKVKCDSCNIFITKGNISHHIKTRRHIQNEADV